MGYMLKQNTTFLEIVTHAKQLHQVITDAYNPLSVEITHTRFFTIFSLKVFDRVYDHNYYILETLKNSGDILDWSWSRPKDLYKQEDEELEAVHISIPEFNPSELFSIRSIIDNYTKENSAKEEEKYDSIGWKRYFDEQCRKQAKSAEASRKRYQAAQAKSRRNRSASS